MQQYRVNYPLLIGLIVGTLVCSGAVYGIWRFQIERKSGWLISEARKSAEEGNYRDAAQFFGQYLSIHTDDQPTRLELARTEIKLTEQDDTSLPEIGEALRVLETTLRNPEVAALPEAKDVRRQLIGIYGRDSIRNYESALDHLNLLLESDPKNAELQVLRATYLAKSGNLDNAIKYSYELIGYDPKTDKFDVSKASAPNDPQVYATLASIVRSKEQKPELADRILDQMVEVNPKLAEAYIQRGRLRNQWGNADGAKADAEKAYQLKPDNIDGLLFMADVAARDKDYAKAQGYIDAGKKDHPGEVRLYQAAATLEMKQQNEGKPEERKTHYDRAMAQIEEGRKKVQGSKALELLFFKAELQIPAADVKGARETIEELQKMRNLRPEVVDYFNARILLAEGKWFQASEALNKLRSQMGDFGRERSMEVDFDLGICYERLGKYDLANDQYELVLQQDQQNEPAKAGVARISAMTGKKPTETPAAGAGNDLDALVNAELKKPKAQQDWRKIDSMVLELAKERKFDETTTKLLQVRVMMTREDFDGASKALAEANKLTPNNLQIMRLAIAVARLNPKVGPAQAMERWKKVSQQFGDQPGLRLDKADILIQQYKDQQDKEPLKHELASLTTGIDSWTPQQKIELWSGMAGRYLNMGMMDEARQYLTLAADAQPDELPLRLALFSLAHDAGDEAGMKEAQEKILKIVGDTNDSSYLYAEARRRLSQVRRGRAGVETLPAIRALVNQALQQRPEWFELHALLGELEVLSNNATAALKHYDRAEELGRPTPSAAAAHIKLLCMNGRYVDASKLLDRIPETARQALLGPLYAEILFRSSETDEALKQAKAATEADPKNAQNQYWYGQLLARSSQAQSVTPERRTAIMGDAIKAMEQAVALQPEFVDAWFALINYQLMQKNEAQAQKVLRDAQLALNGDNLQLFLGRSYEMLHRWFDAETMYRQIYEAAPDDLSRAQQLAAFYTGPIYQRPDRAIKAAPLINQILKAGADKKVPPNDPNLLWARRKAALMLSMTNDYQSMKNAENLLASNSQDGSLLIEDKLAMADILAKRPEPESRLKAIRLLEEVSKVQPLNEPAEISLGELYFAVGSNWTKYRDQMTKTVGKFPNSVDARSAFARRLLARGDKASLDEAARQITKMREIAPNAPATFELTVRLAGKLGKQQQVRNELISRMPKVADIKDLDEAQARGIAGYATLLVELGDLNSAEKLYTDLATRVPAMSFELAKFLGEYRDPQKCFDKLQELYKPANVNDVLAVALSVARSKRDKIGDKYDADIQRWLDAGLRENPDSITLLVTQADLYDLQKKYDEAAGVYRKLLARQDLKDIRRAVVLNNLAFLLALLDSSKTGGDDALNLVNEAASIMGPNSDILDTRAIVLISRKDYKGAIADLELVVTDNPTASKYYHKARAHYLAGENKAAVDAWVKAEALGLNKDALNRMEHEQYDDLKQKIDQLRKQSVTQAEVTRKAG
jgi:tetratricopeptide (TPR) repeat protein